MKECFQSNQVSVWVQGGIQYRHMLNVLAKHQWVGEEVGMDVRVLMLIVWKLSVYLHICAWVSVCVCVCVCVCARVCVCNTHAWQTRILECLCDPVTCVPVWMCVCLCIQYVSLCVSLFVSLCVCVCVCVWSYSYQILLKAWFPWGNDRGHLIGEGWKQHLHPIGHTHDIKVLARQKHVKEIYIAALTALQTRGHSPLPLSIIKATFIVCELHIPHYQ